MEQLLSAEDAHPPISQSDRLRLYLSDGGTCAHPICAYIHLNCSDGPRIGPWATHPRVAAHTMLHAV